MYNVFKFDFDEKNHFISLKWDINIDNDGEETCKRLIIDHKFENANKEYLDYCCELKRLYRPQGITEFLYLDKIKLDNGITANYYGAELGKEIFKIVTQEDIDVNFMESIIKFLIKQCPDDHKLKPNFPKP